MKTSKNIREKFWYYIPTMLFIGTTLLTGNVNGSEWQPETVASDNAELSSVTQNLVFKNLKAQIQKELKGSWCSEDKINLLMDVTLMIQPKTCVDIGSFTGSSVLPVATTLKFLKKGKIFAIDAWSNAEAVKNIDTDDANYEWWSKLNMHSIHTAFTNLMTRWSLNNVCTPIQAPSNQAIQKIDTIDFLHLDGNFSEAGALEDVELYLPKVKTGGYILLSNIFLISKGKQPKLKAFSALLDSCEIVAEIDHENTILFRKI